MFEFRLNAPRKLAPFSSSGLSFHDFNASAGILRVSGVCGDLEEWGPPHGGSYAILFMGQEFEFMRVIEHAPLFSKRRV